MNPYPKPTKSDRLSTKLAADEALRKYRHINVSIAILRDDNCCVFCWFLDGKRVKREEVHHVFSRGKSYGDWREHYTSMLCTCKKHHPFAIQTPGASSILTWVEDILVRANKTPINPSFSHKLFPAITLPKGINHPFKVVTF